MAYNDVINNNRGIRRVFFERIRAKLRAGRISPFGVLRSLAVGIAV